MQSNIDTLLSICLKQIGIFVFSISRGSRLNHPSLKLLTITLKHRSVPVCFTDLTASYTNCKSKQLCVGLKVIITIKSSTRLNILLALTDQFTFLHVNHVKI